MKRTLSAVAVAAMVAVGGMTVSSPAQAGNEGAIIGGVVGGLALGAIVGGAAAQNRAYYGGPGYAYQGGPGYGYQPAYGYRSGYQSYGYAPRRGCVEQRQVWSNRYQGYVVRNVRVPC